MISSIVIFILVLSLLVFVHELGHFVAAKACGIYVDRFSIGMPPRILGFKWGETDYCIGALPIGGFVKMAGQEDSPLSEEEREATYGGVPPDRWFNNKPVWQRFIVLLAGPFMNFVLAVILYAFLAVQGAEVPEAELEARFGLIAPDSPAASAPLYHHDPAKAPADYTGEPDAVGWETGDRVLTFDGAPARNIMDLAIGAILGGGDQVHHVVLEREAPDGTVTAYYSPVSARQLEGEEYVRFGVAPFSTALVREMMPGMPAEATGLQPDDEILRANGKRVDLSTFVAMVEEVPEGGVIDLEIQRGDTRLSVPLQPATIGRFRGLAYGPSSGTGDAARASQPVVVEVTTDFAERSGLKRKDRIVALNGEPVTVASLIEAERAAPGSTLNLEVERPAVLFGLIQRAERIQIAAPVDPVRAIGVGLKSRSVIHRVPAGQVIPEALHQCRVAIERTLGTLAALFSGKVSPKDLGGPVMIAQVTTQAADMGLFWLIKITAFISINLGVFNLLPIPVLDGGQLVLNGIEGIRGKPLSNRFVERFQTVGLLLVVSLMLFVTWNDIGRLLESITP